MKGTVRNRHSSSVQLPRVAQFSRANAKFLSQSHSTVDHAANKISSGQTFDISNPEFDSLTQQITIDLVFSLIISPLIYEEAKDVSSRMLKRTLYRSPVSKCPITDICNLAKSQNHSVSGTSLHSGNAKKGKSCSHAIVLEVKLSHQKLFATTKVSVSKSIFAAENEDETRQNFQKNQPQNPINASKTPLHISPILPRNLMGNIRRRKNTRILLSWQMNGWFRSRARRLSHVKTWTRPGTLKANLSTGKRASHKAVRGYAQNQSISMFREKFPYFLI